MNLRTIIIFALLVCACILPLHAQVGEQSHNFAVGVNGGINLNNVSFSPSVKQKTAYEIYSRDWSSDVCSSDLNIHAHTSRANMMIVLRFML